MILIQRGTLNLWCMLHEVGKPEVDKTWCLTSGRHNPEGKRREQQDRVCLIIWYKDERDKVIDHKQLFPTPQGSLSPLFPTPRHSAVDQSTSVRWINGTELPYRLGFEENAYSGSLLERARALAAHLIQGGFQGAPWPVLVSSKGWILASSGLADIKEVQRELGFSGGCWDRGRGPLL